MRNTYQVISLDIWGNNRDGYEVNNSYTTSHEIVIEDYTTDKEIIKMLKACGYINKQCHFKSFSVEFNDEYLGDVQYHTTKLQGYPICQLRLKGDYNE